MNAKCGHLWTPLHRAAHLGYEPIVCLLLHKGEYTTLQQIKVIVSIDKTMGVHPISYVLSMQYFSLQK